MPALLGARSRRAHQAPPPRESAGKRERGKERGREKRKRKRQRDRERASERGRERERETDRQTDRDRDRQRQTEVRVCQRVSLALVGLFQCHGALNRALLARIPEHAYVSRSLLNLIGLSYRALLPVSVGLF